MGSVDDLLASSQLVSSLEHLFGVLAGLSAS